MCEVLSVSNIHFYYYLRTVFQMSMFYESTHSVNQHIPYRKFNIKNLMNVQGRTRENQGNSLDKKFKECLKELSYSSGNESLEQTTLKNYLFTFTRSRDEFE